MKKLVLVFVILLPVLLLAQQRPGKYLFYIQGGYMSSGYIKESRQKEIVSEKETQHHKCIIFSAGFMINLSEKWRIGPAFTYDHFGTKHRSVEYSNLSYMLRCDKIWKATKKYSFYSGLSLGARKIRRFEDETETESHVSMAYQVYLLGADLKIDRFLIDVNVGYGVAGILNVGLKYRF
ncbi:MAG TPA: hypothetical protein VK483_13000 [Chitinophagaceae bacterium]|nr:hypothetical protein [Chitinophagaceae bacterium]